MNKTIAFKQASAAILVGALSMTPTFANAGIFDTVKGWFAGDPVAPGGSMATPGFNPSAPSQSGLSSADELAKALCSDLGSQLAQAQSSAINQRAAIKSIGASLSEFGLQSIFSASGINTDAILSNVRGAVSNAATQYVETEVKKRVEPLVSPQLNPQPQSPSMNTLR